MGTPHVDEESHKTAGRVIARPLRGPHNRAAPRFATDLTDPGFEWGKPLSPALPPG